VQRALPSGNENEARVTSTEPWLTYAEFVRGVTIQELAMRMQMHEHIVRADIEQMREWIRKGHRTFDNDECDAWQRATLLAGAALSEGSSGSLRVAADCNDKLDELARIDAQRMKDVGL
jgi:hypothetical protein